MPISKQFPLIDFTGSLHQKNACIHQLRLEYSIGKLIASMGRWACHQGLSWEGYCLYSEVGGWLMAELCGLVDLQIGLSDQAQLLAVFWGLVHLLAELCNHLLLIEVSGCVL